MRAVALSLTGGKVSVLQQHKSTGRTVAAVGGKNRVAQGIYDSTPMVQAPLKQKKVNQPLIQQLQQAAY
jgi:hypothetical protein